MENSPELHIIGITLTCFFLNLILLYPIADGIGYYKQGSILDDIDWGSKMISVFDLIFLIIIPGLLILSLNNPMEVIATALISGIFTTIFVSKVKISNTSFVEWDAVEMKKRKKFIKDTWRFTGFVSFLFNLCASVAFFSIYHYIQERGEYGLEGKDISRFLANSPYFWINLALAAVYLFMLMNIHRFFWDDFSKSLHIDGLGEQPIHGEDGIIKKRRECYECRETYFWVKAKYTKPLSGRHKKKEIFYYRPILESVDEDAKHEYDLDAFLEGEERVYKTGERERMAERERQRRERHDENTATPNVSEIVNTLSSAQAMADFYRRQGLNVCAAKTRLKQVQEERQTTKDIDRKNGPLRKQEKFWSEVVDLLEQKG